MTKIMADTLAKVLPHLISKEKKSFVNGRSIRECILLTSEVANFLHKKTIEGSIAIKVDISMAFDTIGWDFLIRVLRNFGFNETFYGWINYIIQSSKVSISINGEQKGYFICKQGVRQGDHIPAFFSI